MNWPEGPKLITGILERELYVVVVRERRDDRSSVREKL